MTFKRSGSSSQRGTFIRPTIDISDPTSAEQRNIFTLPDLIEFNATFNTNHTFCWQYGSNVHLTPRTITHGELYQAILRFSAWLVLHGLGQRPQEVNGKVVKARPVAMLMSSDITWLIAFVSLLRLDIPVRRAVTMIMLMSHSCGRYFACLRGYRHRQSSIWFVKQARKLFYCPRNSIPLSMRQRISFGMLMSQVQLPASMKCYPIRNCWIQPAHWIFLLFLHRQDMLISRIEMS
jgi:hypothetical protein